MFQNRTRSRSVQRGLVPVIGHVRVRARVQQPGHHPGILVGDRVVQACIASFAACVQVGAGGDTRGNRLDVAAPRELRGGPVPAVVRIGQLAKVVARQRIGPQLQQPSRHGRIVVGPGAVERGVAPYVACAQRGSGGHQRSDSSGVTARRHVVQWGASILTTRVHSGSSRHQRGDDGGAISAPGRLVQGSGPEPVARVHFGTDTDEGSNPRWSRLPLRPCARGSRPSGHRARSHPHPVRPRCRMTPTSIPRRPGAVHERSSMVIAHIHIRARRDELIDNSASEAKAGKMQWRPALVVPGVHVCARFNEEGHPSHGLGHRIRAWWGRVAAANRVMQRSAARVVARTNVRSGLNQNEDHQRVPGPACRHV